MNQNRFFLLQPCVITYANRFAMVAGTETLADTFDINIFHRIYTI